MPNGETGSYLIIRMCKYDHQYFYLVVGKALPNTMNI